MNKSRRVLIPAILVILASILLIAYAFYTMPQHPTGPVGGHPPSGMPRPDHKKGFDFSIFGNLAIACGAICYWWLLFKKKLSTPSKPLKKWAKRIYSVHTYTGWAALVLIIIHGGYYLVTDLHNAKILTGVAAFLLMLALAIYGWLFRRVKNKFMRTSHFILSNIWLVALLIHAGGFFIFMAVFTIVLWVVLTKIDSSAKKPLQQKAS